MNLQRASWAAAAAALLAVPAAALIQPLAINFQGKLVNPATGNPQNGVAIMTFKIYNVPTGGAALWTEANDGVSVNNGVFNVTLGTNAALSRDLFLGASAYLEITVNSVNGVADGAAMTPRQPLLMSPYAFTASQLSDLNEVRLIAGPAYSTFTSAGNLVVPGGVQASTAVFTQVSTFSVVSSSGIQIVSGMLDVSQADGVFAKNTGIYAASGTFTNWVNAASATVTGGSGGGYGVTVSSGLLVQNGTLAVNGAGGVDVQYGVQLATIDFTNLTADPNAGGPGFMYYNSSTGSIKVLDGSNNWGYVFGQNLDRKTFFTTSNTAAIGVSKASNATVLVQPIYVPGPMMINQMQTYVTTALGATGDIGVYNSTGGLVLNGGAGTVSTATGLKTVAPRQTGNARFLPPGQYWAAVTFNSTTGRLGGDTLAAAGVIPGVGTVTGGTTSIPASISPTGVTNGTIMFFFEMGP